MTTNYQAEAERTLADVLEWVARAHIRPPDETERNWAKWTRPDGGCVIFRASYRDDIGTLDVYWREGDGGFDHLFSPKSYAYVTRLARDIAMLVALGDEIPSREMLQGLGRP